jgi:hypothetical protein
VKVAITTRVIVANGVDVSAGKISVTVGMISSVTVASAGCASAVCVIFASKVAAIWVYNACTSGVGVIPSVVPHALTTKKSIRIRNTGCRTNFCNNVISPPLASVYHIQTKLANGLFHKIQQLNKLVRIAIKPVPRSNGYCVVF